MECSAVRWQGGTHAPAAAGAWRMRTGVLHTRMARLLAFGTLSARDRRPPRSAVGASRTAPSVTSA
eukprot:168078-Alexandrium_andersonii.AAC.1